MKLTTVPSESTAPIQIVSPFFATSGQSIALVREIFEVRLSKYESEMKRSGLVLIVVGSPNSKFRVINACFVASTSLCTKLKSS